MATDAAARAAVADALSLYTAATDDAVRATLEARYADE